MRRGLFYLVTILSSLLSLSFASSSEQIALGEEEDRSLSDYTCPDHRYPVHLFSHDPLVIYIPEFITEEEAAHLVAVSKDRFTHSEVIDNASGAKANSTVRRSRSTVPPRDAVIRCIEDRALAFQGPDIPRSHLEPLQLVTYSAGETYRHHTDWFEQPAHTADEFGGNRLTSFFVYVAASEDLTGGGTNFPLLDAPEDTTERWCRFVNCDEPWENGVTFRPVPRNAVFWRNLRGDGSGDPRTLHAGLPVTSGTKMGMNIWTRERALSPVYRGED